MAGRRTNLALLVLLAGSFGTGWLVYAVGTRWDRVGAVAHGLLGIAIIALAPWKTAIAQRSLRHRPGGGAASLALSALVAVSLAFGLLHAAGLRTIGPLTSMQLHVGPALVGVPFALWHVVARRVRPRRADLTRRTLVRAAALLGGSGAAYAATEGLWRAASLPGADRRYTGSHEAGSLRPDDMPVTQWLDDSVPSIDAGAWELVLRTEDGERRWTYTELARFDDRVRATLDCTGGWYAVQDWEGVRMDRLLGDRPAARSLSVASASGYGRRFPLSDAPRLLLATRVGGRPLSAGHGFPVRVVAPGRRGFWWVKWVVRIEASRTPWWWQSPFPLT